MERFEILRRSTDQIESNGLVVRYESFTNRRCELETNRNRGNLAVVAHRRLGANSAGFGMR